MGQAKDVLDQESFYFKADLFSMGDIQYVFLIFAQFGEIYLILWRVHATPRVGRCLHLPS